MKYLTVIPRSDKSRTFPQIIVVLVGSILFVNFGIIFAWSSPTIPQLITDTSMRISLDQASYFVVISASTMIVSAPIFSQMIDIIGRKKMMLVATAFQMLFWFLVALSDGIAIFYIARVITGFADAATYAAVPVYIAEMTTPGVRGTWGPSPIISLGLGMFLINLVGAYTTPTTAACIFISLPTAQGILLLFMPESPYYLTMKKKYKDARLSLELLRWTTNVENEFQTLQNNVQNYKPGKIKDLFTMKGNRKALLYCFMLRFAQHFSGFHAMLLYGQYTFENAGTTFSKETSAIIYSFVALLCYCFSPYLLGRFRRKTTILTSCCGSGIALAILAVYFYYDQYYTINEQYLRLIPLIGLLCYALLICPVISVLATITVGEVFPLNVKAHATGLLNIFLAMGWIIVPKLFQFLTANVGIYAPFCMFAGTCFICTPLFLMLVIETRGKTLEDIQIDLRNEK